MMHVLYAMEENALRSYISIKDEMYAAQKTMSADAIRQAKKEILEAASINSYNPETDEPSQLYSIDSNGSAHIPITGYLTPKADPCMAFFGESVTEFSFIQAAAIAADNDSHVKEIIFDFNTNGGRVDGVDQTSQVIANLNKKTIGVNHGAALSAGLWLISQCDKIIDSTPAAFHGSLGVVVEFIDRSKELSSKGIQRVILTSTDAPDKRVDLTKDEGKKIVIQELDDIHNIFAGRVIDGRSKSLGKELTRDYVNENFGAGGILVSEKAIKVGLSDGVMNPIKSQNSSVKSEEHETEQEPANPNKNEHACRLTDPKKYTSFRRKNNAAQIDGKRIDHIYGIKEGKSELQAIRYPKNIWNVSDARSNCTKNKGISFEPATGTAGGNGASVTGCVNCGKQSTHSNENPAEAGEKKRRFTNMSLKQLLDENPTAKAEYEENIKNAKAEGKTEAHAIFAKVEPYFTGEKTYPKNIMAHAFKALSGEQGSDVFIGAVAAYDAAKEAMASETAQNESEQNPDTPSDPPEGPKGAAKTVDDIKAMAEADGVGA